MARYLIAGVGRFGCLACQRLRQQDDKAEILLVDQNTEKLALIAPQHAVKIAVGDAANYLNAALVSDKPPDWIIPAIPCHLAFDWLWLQRPEAEVWRQIPVPPAVGSDLPFNHRGPSGEVYLSLSRQKCPDDCPAPPDNCYATGQPRKYNLYDYLANSAWQNYSSLIIRSRQLAPGVGGYKPADLWQLWRQVLLSERRVLVSTACRCHGVSHALERLTEKERRLEI